jgi:hypothetical protein
LRITCGPKSNVAPLHSGNLKFLSRWTTHKCARRTNGITRFDWRLMGRRRSHCESRRRNAEVNERRGHPPDQRKLFLGGISGESTSGSGPRMLIEELAQAMLETVKRMSPEEKAKLRQQLDKSVQKTCSGCGIPTISRNTLCDVCDSLYAALTRTSAACQYWEQVDSEARREVQRIKHLCGMSDVDEEN